MVQKGQCLCGAVQLTIKEDQDSQVACHCKLMGLKSRPGLTNSAGLDCQKVAGGPYTSNVVVDDDKLEIQGETKEFKNTAVSGNEGE